ncbi:MAG TPA: YciI family protein [Candidatus Acidoferrum sp.]
MKFLLAVYLEPNALQGLSRSEQAELNRVSVGYNEELEKQGHFLAASALQPAFTAKTVRKRGGKIKVTDGPFAETKEVLGGFIFVEARDMEEALRIAENIPVSKYGSIEVRPDMPIG